MGRGAPVMRLIGKGQSPQNPHVWQECFTFLSRHHGGAEIELTLLFADIRGSTTLEEGMPATEFRAILDRFYKVATQAILDHDGGVDEFVGDLIAPRSRRTHPPLLDGGSAAQPHSRTTRP